MKWLTTAIATILFAGTIAAAQRHVSVPGATWDQIVPYLESNLRVEYTEAGLVVGTSGAPYERKLVEPYDEALGELATVLLGDALNTRSFSKALERVTRTLEAKGADPRKLSGDELAAAVWRELAADDRFVSRLRATFSTAQDEGRLRCWICDNGFEPQHLAKR